jgi:hypothetical protein
MQDGSRGKGEMQKSMHVCWSLGGSPVTGKNAEVLVMGVCIYSDSIM